MKSENHEKTRVEMLPFIHLDPSNPSTIYIALCFSKNQCELHGIVTSFVTFDYTSIFDYTLYVKTVEIVAASTDLGNVVVTSQVWWFHLLRSYLGAIGFIIGSSELESLWETVYPSDQ